MGQKWFSKEEIASWPTRHKKCRSCQEVLPFEKFDKHRQAMFGYNTICKVCRKPTTKKNYYAQTPEKLLYDRAKSRATRLGRDFTITIDDIVIPKLCPILGIPLAQRTGPGSPSLDRINSDRGYVPGNVHVISTRANTLKNNATKDEIRALAVWLDIVVSSN